ncbi:dimethyl sulfoxide reductase anchor subunit family protein [Vibrio sp. WXL103]|uniref:dimethyl sulfoxide reductase anchor subunit family protein n=1 Tax=Vibrio sp. WXL103 TaxID=3450710 RepID=UPI003EC8B1AB
MSQLSLVFFTVLAQSAVGMFIALGVVELLFKPDRKAMSQSLMVTLIILGIGAIASMTHLGQPLRMLNVAFGLAHGSALSLEIVALSLFGASALGYTAMRWFDIAGKMQNLVLCLAMALGIVFVLAIANVYTLATVPTWSTRFTPFQFLMTAAVVGPIAAATVLAWLLPQSESQAPQKLLAKMALVLAVVSLSGYAAYLVWLGQLDVSTNPFALVLDAFSLIAVRVGLLIGGVLLWLAFTIDQPRKPLLIACFAMIVCSELIGRIFFYDVYLRAGSGM